MPSRKGKEVAGEESSGKRKRDGKEKAGGGRRRKNRGVLQFFDDAAYELEEEDESSDDSDLDDGFLEDEFKTHDEGKNEFAKDQQFPLFPKEEELSEEELEKMLEERYRPGASFVKYAEDPYGSKRSIEVDAVIPSYKDPTIWKIKCMVGRERHSAFCLMQKYVDLLALGTKLQIISAFALDHVKGFIYIEAERQNDVNEACKGLCSIYSSRVTAVPSNEVSHLLSVRSKYNEVSVGTWARVKNGKYKGDLAQVVSMDDARKKATLKLIPRIDLQAMAEKYGGGVASKKTAKGGGIASKKTATPTPRLISSTELEEFRPLMQYRRDRDTGQAFEVLDGLMLKDGYLYKKVAIDSLNFWGVMPSEDELLKFEPCKKEEPDSQEWLTQLFGEQRKTRTRCESGGGNDKGGGKGKGGGKDKGGGKGEGSSSASTSSSFEVHDLVVFGRKDFGVIVGTEKEDYFKILKEGSEGPVVVTVELRQLKNASFDKKFHALDHRMKTISVNDAVRVLEGPLQDRQGIVKQIYRGIIFFYDENEQENGGFICCKSQICEKTKLSVDAVKGKGDESGFQGFEDFPSSPKSPLSPKKAWQASEKSTNFNRDDKDGMFSIGQSLRIRVGPLKGYLCRVLAVRRSDITVKLDSQQKILTVKSEHLAEVRGKSSAISLGDDVDSAKPFDLLGTQDGSTDWMAGAGTSAEGDRWGAGGLSTERSSWPAFPSSGFAVQPESSSGNALNSADNSTSKDVEDDGPWGSKATKKENSTWGSAVANEKAAGNESAWGGFAAEPKNQTGAWGSGGGNSGQSETEASGWNKATNVDGSQTGSWGAVKKDSGSGNSGQSEAEASGWNKATNVDGSQTGSWGSAKKDSATGWGKSTDPQESSPGMGSGESSWGKPAAAVWGSKDDSNGSEAAWNNSTSVPESQTGWSSNAGGSLWNKQDGGGSSWNKQGGGSSWAKQSDVNMEDESREARIDGGCGSGGGRGRGRGRGGGNACFKCGETGHMSRECTQGGGGGRGGGGSGGNACFKCGETGHMSRECTQGGGGGRGSGGNACFKCGETGHMARECTQGGGSGGGNACFKCGETGHMARECTQGGGGGRGAGGGNACFKCGETGHMSRECTQGGGGGRGGGGGNACFKCGEVGHMARDCSQGGGGGGGGGRYGGGGGNSCFKCGETGHMARDCTQGGGNGGGSWRSGGGGSGGDSLGKAADKWGSGDGSGGSKAAWGAASWKSAKPDTEPKNQNAGWGSRGWNSVQSDAETDNQTGGWGNPGSSKAEPNNQTGAWGTAGGTSVQSDSEPKNHTGGWAKASGSIAETHNHTGGWAMGGGSSVQLDAVPINQSGVWGNAGSSNAENSKNLTGGWGISGGNSGQSEAELSGWGKMKNDGELGSGKSMDPQESAAGTGSAEKSWGKPAEKWSSKDDSSESKSVWNSSTLAAPESKTGGWGSGAGTSSLNKQDGEGSSWGKQGGGSSWGNQSGGSSWTNTEKKDSWGKPSGGDQGFGGSGGGRGRGGGGNACYKCGETGHMARECTQGGVGGGGSSGGGGNACFKCGETGHMARDCSQGGGGGGRYGSGVGGNACFKCGETGHMARECSQGGGGGGRGGGGGGGGGCFKCGEQGHFARECPNSSR